MYTWSLPIMTLSSVQFKILCLTLSALFATLEGYYVDVLTNAISLARVLFNVPMLLCLGGHQCHDI